MTLNKLKKNKVKCNYDKCNKVQWGPKVGPLVKMPLLTNLTNYFHFISIIYFLSYYYLLSEDWKNEHAYQNFLPFGMSFYLLNGKSKSLQGYGLIMWTLVHEISLV